MSSSRRESKSSSKRGKQSRKSNSAQKHMLGVLGGGQQEARQDDRRYMTYSMTDRDEGVVHLSPRVNGNSYLRMDEDDEDPALVSYEAMPIDHPTDFLRPTGCPSIPSLSPSTSCRSSPLRRKPGLSRSMAWSQDSQEADRTLKRSKTTSGTSRGRPPVVTPPKATIVHWEQKISSPMDLAEALNRAIETSESIR